VSQWLSSNYLSSDPMSLLSVNMHVFSTVSAPKTSQQTMAWPHPMACALDGILEKSGAMIWWCH
jgi:hypothetical protein